MTTNTIHECFPYLRVHDARAAIRFYERAFGAVFKFDLIEPGGRVGHAELTLGPATLMLSEAFPEFGIEAPPVTGYHGASLHLHVDDCDGFAAKAVAEGATMIREPVDQFYGERSCKIRDPFGHEWMIGSSLETLTPEEMQRRYDALFA